MPTNDERLYYIRLTKAGFQGLAVKQAFLDARPLVKVSADEEAEPPVEEVLYTEQDNLTYEAAMRLYKPHSVALLQEVEGDAPINLGTLDQYDTLPEEMTHAFFALSNPKLQPLEIAALAAQAASVNTPLNQVLIPWGADKNNYLTTGQLPA